MGKKKKKGNPITQQDFSSLSFGKAVFSMTLEKLDWGLEAQGAPKQHIRLQHTLTDDGESYQVDCSYQVDGEGIHVSYSFLSC